MKTLSNRSWRFTAAIVTGVITLSPAAAFAQTTPNMYQDGSGESSAERRERIRSYRRQSSENQAKIDALGPVANPVVIMPVLFGVALSNLSPNFGDPRSGGRTHEGEDIMAVKGTPIISPTNAVVIRIGNGVTEGNYVYTANPGGETFVYIHLDRIGEGIAVGNVLSQGSLIGYVGNTGNASGGAAHLHFEIHDASDIPQDPYPRLKGELSITDKISYLTNILSQTSDSTALAQLLVVNFRSTFAGALAANIALPVQITVALASIPAGSTGSSTSLPAGDLDIGSAGTAVVALQTYIIQAASGPAVARLKSAGATGNFGPITQAALAEYQALHGLTPANGYYGPVTRAYVASHPLAGSQVPTPTPSTSTMLTRNLKSGMTGEDIRILQKILNRNGFAVALSGAGSLNNETTYFGPATKAAVIRFQLAKNIAPAAGYVGPVTRAAMAGLSF